jgi:GntR family transcriptional regulator, sialic acid-inducible nan operon repressor
MRLKFEGPIPRRKLSHEILDRLLEQIETGKLTPGSRLPSERELMDRYGVGRPAIREAMQTLENMGLIEIAHGERARVNSLEARDMLARIDRAARHLLSTSPQTLEHLKEARLLFEVGMVKIAAQRATEENVTQLQRSVAELEQSPLGTPRFVSADMSFHTILASISGNPICVAVSEAMLSWLREYHRELVHVPGAENVTIAEHRRILECVANNDPDRAAQAMTDHLTRVSQLYRSTHRTARRKKK